MAGLCPVIVFSEVNKPSLEKPAQGKVNFQNTEIFSLKYKKPFIRKMYFMFEMNTWCKNDPSKCICKSCPSTWSRAPSENNSGIRKRICVPSSLRHIRNQYLTRKKFEQTVRYFAASDFKEGM